ncbi:hypothetical protein UFOVP450_55 [uncultured Caudovirales phage]|uniref:NAD-dependent epimerase/dehydratase domain-containing protein n=1 Tax=uncultured Caudovirales phage TaxID=2100421 RepID=A0A6J5MDI7_9CAUD|nr:hypothetical protein UFOVP450_55 [uncultured Caudovirales phage]
MVIGKGLLARAFRGYAADQEIIIFASGVSNSRETDEQAFLRERSLLGSLNNTKAKLIYFSTTSVLDPSLTQSRYVQHKLQMESYIENHIENYVIFRLPNVVGQSNNPNTFFNSMRSGLEEGEVVIMREAYRRLIDVDDLTTYLPDIISHQNRKIIDVGFNNQTSVQELVELMGDILGAQYVQHLKDGGSSYDIDNACFLSYLASDCVGLLQDYNYILLKKYLKDNDNILPTQ